MNNGNRFSKSIHSESRWRIWTPSNLPALVAAIAVVIASFIAEDFSRALERHDLREQLQDQVNLISSKLQGHITASVELVRGLSATIATEPDIKQERFSSLARSLNHDRNDVRNIAAAPGFVVSMVYPIEGNRPALGLDYRVNEAQRAMALHTRDSRSITFAGPVNLVQGGRGFIVHYPIFNSLQDGSERFWGILSAVIDADKLYRATGLMEQNGARFALIGRDGKGLEGAQFFGDISTIADDPVSVSIDFGVGEWILYAIPEKGWSVEPKNLWLIRLGAVFALLLIVGPILFISWLYRERGMHLADNVANQKKLARVTKRLEMALQTSQIGVWEFDPDTKQSSWDARMCELYGLDINAKGSPDLWRQFAHPDDLHRVTRELKDSIHNGTLFKTEFRLRPIAGQERTIRAVGSLLIDRHGERRFIGVNWDISEDVARERELEEARAESERRYKALEVAQEKIRESALHDFLTGLPNRRYLDDLLNERLGIGPVLDDQVCLLKIDLDGFKEVNDSYGHAAGDAILVQVAHLLREVINKNEFTARVGGDEFIILCRSDEDLERPIDLSKQILEALHTPIEFNGRQCRVGASIGITVGADAGNDPDRLLTNADLALYQAKKTGKGGYCFFSEPLVQKARLQRQMADDLLRGIENREFIAFYQGQYCAERHELVGAEALARWQHPERGLVGPQEFIDLAESLGVMATIDAQILDHVIATRKQFANNGLDLPRMSVNVSAKRLGDKDLITNLKKLDINPANLTFELVESTFLDRSDSQVAANIRQIRDMGIDIEIDDFGTAYASIVSLTHLLPNRLKIDRQLVQPIIESADQRELVHSIIHIGRTLGIGAVAEGVETFEHAEILRIMGVDVLQGYAFCHPMPAEDFLQHHRDGTYLLEHQSSVG